MQALTHTPLELSRAQNNARPPLFDKLEAERDQYRRQGLYKEAGQAQARLEQAKVDEEEKRLRALAEKHRMELSALEEANSLEYAKFAKEWERRLAELTQNISDQEQLLQLRHAEMQDQFAQLCSMEVVKPKWSRVLLNMRVQEEHLIKQRNFKVAANLKKAADQLEEKEYNQAVASQHARQAMEGAKLQARRIREAEALHKKLQMSYDEHVLMQERELEKLMKRTAASRLALLRNQAHMMFLLEQALKGWFNPKKFGLPPPPLLSPPLPMSPGARISLERESRPSTSYSLPPTRRSNPQGPSLSAMSPASSAEFKMGRRGAPGSPSLVNGRHPQLSPTPNYKPSSPSPLRPSPPPSASTFNALLPKEPQGNGGPTPAPHSNGS